MSYDYGWTVVKCNSDECGADAILQGYEFFRTEGEALSFLANVRDDDPKYGNGWTTLRVSMWRSEEVAA